MILFLKLLGLAVALLLGQSLVAEVLPVRTRPDLVLIFALAMGLRAAATQGLVLAFGMGFVFDVLSGSPPGLYALLRGTAAAATRLLDRALYLRAALPWAIYVAGYAVFDWILLGGALRLFAPDASLTWSELALRVPGSAILTTLIAAPLLAVFMRLDFDPEGESAWPTLGSSGSRTRP